MKITELTFDFHLVKDEIEIDIMLCKLCYPSSTPDLNAFMRLMRKDPENIKTNSLKCIAIVCDCEKLLAPGIVKAPYLKHLKNRLNRWAKIHLFVQKLETRKLEKHELLQKQQTSSAS